MIWLFFTESVFRMRTDVVGLYWLMTYHRILAWAPWWMQLIALLELSDPTSFLILVAQFIAFYVLCCVSLFVFCSFSFLHRCCLSFDVLGLVTQMLFLDCPYTYMHIQWFLIFTDLRWEVIMKRKCKQWLSTMPSISRKWVITSH
jgi:hypothetical protein